MKLLLSVLISLSVISCEKSNEAKPTPVDKIKVAIRPVVINDNSSRSETDVLWIDIKK